MLFFFFFFFFSSRRRHTRCGRDWSSDVCSSDLEFFPLRPRWKRCEPQFSGQFPWIAGIAGGAYDDQNHTRSEEHTSELQSRPHLVCRLLLEKKNEAVDRSSSRAATTNSVAADHI